MTRYIPFLLFFISCQTSSKSEVNFVLTDSLNQRTVELLSQGKFDSAELILKNILSINNQDSQALSNLVQLRIVTGEPELAFKMADSINKNNSWTWMLIIKGIAMEQIEDVDSAIYYYEYALSNESDSLIRFYSPIIQTIINKKPRTKEELDSIGLEDIILRNELEYYAGGGWYEINYQPSEKKFRLDTIMYWSQMSKYLNTNGIAYYRADKTETGFLIYTKEKFADRARELGLTLVE